MSLVRTFGSVEEVRHAVARSLGFGLRASSLDSEADIENDSPVAERAGFAGGEAEGAAGVANEVGSSEADEALRSILEKLEADELRSER